MESLIPPGGSLRLLYVGDGEPDGLPLPGPSEAAWDVEKVASAEDCVRAVGRRGYDMLLIGPGFNPEAGDSILAWCRQNQPRLPVLLLDSSAEREKDAGRGPRPAAEPTGAVRAGRSAFVAEGFLAEAEARAFLATTSDLIGSLDAEGRIEAINQRALSFLGRPAREVVGTRFMDWVAPAERAALRECLALVREGRRARCDVRFSLDPGERIGSATLLSV